MWAHTEKEFRDMVANLSGHSQCDLIRWWNNKSKPYADMFGHWIVIEEFLKEEKDA